MWKAWANSTVVVMHDTQSSRVSRAPFGSLPKSCPQLLLTWLPTLYFAIPYSGKFSWGPNFRDFRNPRPKRENKNREINLNTWTFAWTFGLVEIFARAFCALWSRSIWRQHCIAISDDVLLSLMGDLSSSVKSGNDKRAWSIARTSAKHEIKTAKISFGGETGFSQKFGPAKTSCYTVWNERPCK